MTINSFMAEMSKLKRMMSKLRGKKNEGGLYEFFFVYCPFCGGKVEEE